MGFYEGIGFILKKELIDVNYIDDLLRHSILMIWEKYEPLPKESRGVMNRSVYENFEYLVNELKKYIEKHPELRT